MAGDKKPPPKGAPKPFLGDEELSNELDAWDSMFDGLHGGPEATQTPADEPVMAWPAPAAESKPQRVEPSALRADNTVNEDLDVQMTLDNAVEADATSDATSIDMQAAPARAKFQKHADPLETDFSEIGASTAPSALGDFLGAAPGRERPGTAPGYEDDDDPHTSVSARGGTPVPIDDDDVLTSASRPNAMMPSGDDDDEDDFSLDAPIPPPPLAVVKSIPPPPPQPHTRRTGHDFASKQIRIHQN